MHFILWSAKCMILHDITIWSYTGSCGKNWASQWEDHQAPDRSSRCQSQQDLPRKFENHRRDCLEHEHFLGFSVLKHWIFWHKSKSQNRKNRFLLTHPVTKAEGLKNFKDRFHHGFNLRAGPPCVWVGSLDPHRRHVETQLLLLAKNTPAMGPGSRVST